RSGLAIFKVSSMIGSQERNSDFGSLGSPAELAIWSKTLALDDSRTIEIIRSLVEIGDAANIRLEHAALNNLRKVFSRWPIKKRYPPRLETKCLPNERLPSRFSMFVEEHRSARKVYVLQKCNG